MWCENMWLEFYSMIHALKIRLIYWTYVHTVQHMPSYRCYQLESFKLKKNICIFARNSIREHGLNLMFQYSDAGLQMGIHFEFCFRTKLLCIRVFYTYWMVLFWDLVESISFFLQRKKRTDVTINDYIGLIFIFTLLP